MAWSTRRKGRRLIRKAIATTAIVLGVLLLALPQTLGNVAYMALGALLVVGGSVVLGVFRR